MAIFISSPTHAIQPHRTIFLPCWRLSVKQVITVKKHQKCLQIRPTWQCYKYTLHSFKGQSNEISIFDSFIKYLAPGPCSHPNTFAHRTSIIPKPRFLYSFFTLNILSTVFTSLDLVRLFTEENHCCQITENSAKSLNIAVENNYL